MSLSTEFKPCVLVPVYNHQQVLAQTLTNIRHFDLPVVLVDDGSNALCKSVMRELAAADPQHIHLIERDANGGKGAALKTGLRAAQQLGFTHALQIDADGQHDTSDIPHFLQLAQARPLCLIAGQPDYDESVPKVRLYCRYLTHILVWLNTLSFAIRDSMCGFRVYPVARSCELLDAEYMGDRMDFDTEFIVRWYWRNWPVQQVLTRVIYPENGVSHFNLWHDNTLITWMHIRLLFGMLWRSPRLLMRNLMGGKGHGGKADE